MVKVIKHVCTITCRNQSKGAMSSLSRMPSTEAAFLNWMAIWTGVAGGGFRNLALRWQPGFYVQAVSGTEVTQVPLTHWFQLRWVGTSRTCQGGHISWIAPSDSQQWRPLHQPP